MGRERTRAEIRQQFERVRDTWLPGTTLRHKRTGETWIMGTPHRAEFWIMRPSPAARILVSPLDLEKNYIRVISDPAELPKSTLHMEAAHGR